MVACRRFLPLLLIVVASAAGQQPDNPIDTAPDSMRENIQKIIAAIGQIPSWEEERENMLSAVERVYERNGWTEEPDLFTLDVMREVESLPPLAFQQRFDTLVGMVSDRYLLTEPQEQTLRRTLNRELHQTFARHSGRIMQYGLEALQTRAAGDAITPEQVARWTELAEPVFLDTRDRMLAAADRFMGELDPDQQALLRRDMEAGMRRGGKMLEMAQEWKRGGWKPGDWGLDLDPVQIAGEARRAADAEAGGEKPAVAATPGKSASPADGSGDAPPSEPPADAAPEEPAGVGAAPQAKAPQPATASPSDNDPWAQHVRAFIARYQLSDDQQQRAWRIYTEVREHRDRVTRKAADGRDAGAAEKQKAAVDRLFEQLNRRLERVPTRAQRRAVEAASPAKSGAASPPSKVRSDAPPGDAVPPQKP